MLISKMVDTFLKVLFLFYISISLKYLSLHSSNVLGISEMFPSDSAFLFWKARSKK